MLFKTFTTTACVGLALVSNHIYALPSYDLVSLGFYDAEHTSASGLNYSNVEQLNQAGQVLGNSRRFSSDAYNGQTAWLYNGAQTLNIGLTGNEYTRFDGYQYSRALLLNDSGQASGDSHRYNVPGDDLGQSAWFYNSFNTVRIGLIGAGYTRQDGYAISTSVGLNQVGQVIGHSNRYDEASPYLGVSAWLYDGTDTINVGLTGSEHTGSNGFQYSQVGQLNDAGQVIGYSYRFNNIGEDLGQSVWLYSGGQTLNVGLTGSTYTRSDGYRTSFIRELNQAGQVIGVSNRYTARGNGGQSAWLYDGGTTVNIGLTGESYTSSRGWQFSDVSDLNEAGEAAGVSARYVNGTSMVAWLYDGNSTRDISLADTEHTDIQGNINNEIRGLNETGQVVGVAQRFSESGIDLGQSAWFYDGVDTINIGLTDDQHSTSVGYRHSDVVQLNDSGQVAGSATRYTDFVGQSGTTAWYFDAASGLTYYHDFSIRQSDGYAASYAEYLGSDGLMLGYYQLFDDTDSSYLGNRAFGFTVEDGFFDFDLVIDQLSDDFDWNYLARAIQSNDSGQVVGYGPLTGMPDSRIVFLATPSAVPVPAAFWLFGSGVLLLAGMAKKTNT